jgi:hypothetical protein
MLSLGGAVWAGGASALQSIRIVIQLGRSATDRGASAPLAGRLTMLSLGGAVWAGGASAPQSIRIVI